MQRKRIFKSALNNVKYILDQPIKVQEFFAMSEKEQEKLLEQVQG